MYEFYNDGKSVFKLEVIDGKLFAHAKVAKWDKATLALSLQVWKQFTEHALDSGYTEVFSIIPKDRKILKFNLMFGGTILSELDDCYVIIFIL